MSLLVTAVANNNVDYCFESDLALFNVIQVSNVQKNIEFRRLSVNSTGVFMEGWLVDIYSDGPQAQGLPF